MKRLTAVFLIGLSGCATTAQWQHSALTGPEADRQYAIDHGTCTRTSYAAAPPQAPPVQPSGYTVQGQSQTAGTYGTATTTYSGQVQPQPNIANGTASIIAAGQAGAADRARRDIYVGCMAERGWSRPSQ